MKVNDKTRRKSRVVNLALATIASGTVLSANVQAEKAHVEPLPGAPFLMLGSYDLASIGYSLDEFVLEGTARSYHLTAKGGSDGEWAAREGDTAPYRTRIAVVKPTDPASFNGTVVVEWLNVSGGLDVPVDWITLHREMTRNGYAYVAVSAQQVGVEGGANLGRGSAAPLKQVNPERYGQLAHPGDAYAFDIYTDVARMLRGKSRTQLLGELVPQRLLAVGESQSAFFLTTYVNAVDPLAQEYDGFLIHSRSGAAAPLDGSPIIGGDPEKLKLPVRLRSGLRVPTMQVHTETDITGLAGSIGFYAARQPDTSMLRTWEIAGAAHADNYLFAVGTIDSGLLPIEQLAQAWQPIDNLQGQPLSNAMNNAPQHHYVTEAALAHLERWVRDGKAPPAGVALELTDAVAPAIATDALGLARGGVRTPWVEVPVAVLSGSGGPPEMPLIGSSQTFDQKTLEQLYPGGRSEYLEKFTASLDRAIDGGYILAADRAEILELARLGYPGQ